MSFTVKFTRFAEQDFDEIIHHIAKDNPYQALKFVDELEKRTIQTLSVFPRSGSAYKGFRYLPLDNYLVVYDIDETDSVVNVLLVTEGHRQWRELLIGRASNYD